MCINQCIVTWLKRNCLTGANGHTRKLWFSRRHVKQGNLLEQWMVLALAIRLPRWANGSAMLAYMNWTKALMTAWTPKLCLGLMIVVGLMFSNQHIIMIFIRNNCADTKKKEEKKLTHSYIIIQTWTQLSSFVWLLWRVYLLWLCLQARTGYLKTCFNQPTTTMELALNESDKSRPKIAKKDKTSKHVINLVLSVFCSVTLYI
jgi:hypothetical protein